MKKKKSVLVFAMILLSTFHLIAQQQFADIDPKWEKYYEEHPSGINESHQAIDFIRIIELVDFVPNSIRFEKDANFFKKVLLRLEIATFKQLQITGLYYSRTYKHDDYFYLYNLTYKKIAKDTWDKYCPYLIPLMDLDQTIKLH